MNPHDGTQLWADVRWRNGWRIQSHCELPVSRLLDPRGETKRHGTFGMCERGLNRAVGPGDSVDHLVVILHGLGRTRHSMRRVDRVLRQSGLATARLDYPSTRAKIDEHAEKVAELLAHTPPVKKLSFVTHSLGGLIVRALFARQQRWQSSVHRILMFAPPNQGAVLARQVDNPATRMVMGPSFVQIVDGVPSSLAIPDAPIAIVAGQVGRTDTDGLVKIEETKLEGMAEHTVVPSIHTFVMNHPTAIHQAVSFLGAPQSV